MVVCFSACKTEFYRGVLCPGFPIFFLSLWTLSVWNWDHLKPRLPMFTIAGAAYKSRWTNNLSREAEPLLS